MNYHFKIIAKDSSKQKDIENILLGYIKKCFRGADYNNERKENFNKRYKSSSKKDILASYGFTKQEATSLLESNPKLDIYDYLKKRGKISHSGYCPTRKEQYNYMSSFKGLYIDLDLENGTIERLDTDTQEKTIINKEN